MAVLTLIAGGALIFLVLQTGPLPARQAPGVKQIVLEHTPTPFQPLEPTASFTPTLAPPTETPVPTPTIDPRPSPTPPPPLEIPWDNGIEIPQDQLRILVMGSDERPGGGFRTDVMMLVVINPQHGTGSVISFPRDLYVFIPGWGQDRLNTVMTRGGFQMMAETFQYNFGVRPDHYVMTNFKGFEEIIDSLGGITITAEKTLTDKCDLLWQEAGSCTVNAGEPLIMDGKSALWYVRSRYSSSDFERTRRQQEVLQALFKRLMKVDVVFHAPEWYEIYKNNVQTDLGVENVLPLVKVARRLSKPGQVQRFYIGPGEVYDFINEYGAMVLVPNPYAVSAVVQKALQP